MTTVVELPTAWTRLAAAIAELRPVRLCYHGRQRTVCPHALGWKNHRPMLLALQIGEEATGESSVAPRQGWRCMFVDEIEVVTTADPASRWQSATTYNPLHPFNSVDEISVAISSDDPQQPS